MTITKKFLNFCESRRDISDYLIKSDFNMKILIIDRTLISNIVLYIGEL